MMLKFSGLSYALEEADGTAQIFGKLVDVSNASHTYDLYVELHNATDFAEFR